MLILQLFSKESEELLLMISKLATLGDAIRVLILTRHMNSLPNSVGSFVETMKKAVASCIQ